MIINDNNFKEILKGLCLVEISGESCANCLTLMPILAQIAKDRNDINLYHIEASNDTLKIIELYEVTQAPTILLLNDCNLIAKVKGFQPQEILELWIDAKIEEFKKKV